MIVEIMGVSLFADAHTWWEEDGYNNVVCMALTWAAGSGRTSMEIRCIVERENQLLGIYSIVHTIPESL